MKIDNILWIVLLIFLSVVIPVSCEKEAFISGGNGLADWTEHSHSSLARPDYEKIFNPNQVQRLDIMIENEYWQVMQADLMEKLRINTGPPVKKKTENHVLLIPQKEKPVYVPCQLYFEGRQWYDVGIRYKGNSSLSSPVRSGIGKLPFRLEFDHFESENPAISGQTFYGFSQLSFANGFKDVSLIHEKVASDVFRDFGIPAPHTAFYRIFVDYGEGPVYFGLYTMIEVVFDGPMLIQQFGSETGNCYKPEGPGAQFNDPSLVNPIFFPNKTNPRADLADVRAMTMALLSEIRLLDPVRWRSELESVFNVDLFLKWLAANTTMRNWDSYGRMNHNYYLYHNPDNDLLSWIPWDNNEAFEDGTVDSDNPENQALEYDFSNLDQSTRGPGEIPPWPLISFLYKDPEYKHKYDQYIRDFINGPFSFPVISERFSHAHFLIAPYAIGPDGEWIDYTFIPDEGFFESSLDKLLNFVNERLVRASEYLK